MASMVMKILQSVTTCKECPNRRYYSAGRYECSKMDGAPLSDDCVIPQWCPLSDHPGPVAARAARSLEDARTVLQIAKGEAPTADVTRLRELINIAAGQVARP